jgi:hypothetical protein
MQASHSMGSLPQFSAARFQRHNDKIKQLTAGVMSRSSSSSGLTRNSKSSAEKQRQREADRHAIMHKVKTMRASLSAKSLLY